MWDHVGLWPKQEKPLLDLNGNKHFPSWIPESCRPQPVEYKAGLDTTHNPRVDMGNAQQRNHEQLGRSTSAGQTESAGKVLHLRRVAMRSR